MSQRRNLFLSEGRCVLHNGNCGNYSTEGGRSTRNKSVTQEHNLLHQDSLRMTYDASKTYCRCRDSTVCTVQSLWVSAQAATPVYGPHRRLKMTYGTSKTYYTLSLHLLQASSFVCRILMSSNDSFKFCNEPAAKVQKGGGKNPFL